MIMSRPMHGPNPKWDASYNLGYASLNAVVKVTVLEMPCTVVAEFSHKLGEVAKQVSVRPLRAALTKRVQWINIGGSAQLLIGWSQTAGSFSGETTGRRLISNEGEGFLHCSVQELWKKGIQEEFTSATLRLSGTRKKFDIQPAHRAAVPLRWSFHEKKLPVLLVELNGLVFRLRVDSVAMTNDGIPLVSAIPRARYADAMN